MFMRLRKILSYVRRSPKCWPKERESLSLDEYRDIASTLSRPTRMQMEAYAKHVSNAHSWYKLWYLGDLDAFRLTFFVNPSAGMGLASDGNGHEEEYRLVERTNENTTLGNVIGGFHYSDPPTAERLVRFGHLHYGRDRETLLIHDPTSNRCFDVPKSIVATGSVLVSAVISTFVTDAMRSKKAVRAFRRLKWPEESGGRIAKLEIYERARMLIDNPSKAVFVRPGDPRAADDGDISFVDYPLHLLFEKERQRQRKEMVGAMSRVCDLLWQSSDANSAGHP